MTLTDFEGVPVDSTGIEMPGAGGGLNKALAIDEMELHHGDEGTLVLRYKVVKVRFDPIKDSDHLQRVHVLQVTNAASIDGETVDAVLEEQERRNEEARGVKRLPFNPEDGDADDVDNPDDDAAGQPAAE